MNIIVCIKQVPDTTTVIQIDGSGKDIVKDDLSYIISPYDEFAIEEALKLRDEHGGNVTLLTVGPDSAKEALRTGLAMGADDAIHVVHETSPIHVDPMTTAKLITKALTDRDYSLVLCGRQAIDDDAAQMGSLLAEMLHIPQVSFVIKLEVDGENIKAHRSIEGATQVVESKMPIVLTTQKGLNIPRYPSLKGIRTARKKPIEDIDAGSLGVNLTPSVKVVEMFLPPSRPETRFVDSVPELARLLHEEAKVI